MQPVRGVREGVGEGEGGAARDGENEFWRSGSARPEGGESEDGTVSPRRGWFEWGKRRGQSASDLAGAAAVALVLATAVYGVVINGDAQRLQAKALSVVDRLALRWGFVIERAVVEGHKRLTEAEIDEALGDRRSVSILNYDTEAARARLERIGWVKSARVTRLWPSTLVVEIEERRPFALWRPEVGGAAAPAGAGGTEGQTDGQTVVIDADGATLGPLRPGPLAALPLVAGTGAAQAARRLVSVLDAAPALKARVALAERISDRRWDLVLKEGLRLKLAEGGLDAASLNGVAAAIDSLKLPLSDVAALDFRVANQIGLELKDPSDENRRRALMLLATPGRGRSREQL